MKKTFNSILYMWGVALINTIKYSISKTSQSLFGFKNKNNFHTSEGLWLTLKYT